MKLCPGMFISSISLVIRRALPLLFTGFIAGQAVVWLLTPRKLSQ